MTMSEDKKAQLVERAQKLFEKLFLTIRYAPNVEILSLNITMAQFKILISLAASGPMRMSDLAASVGTNVKSTTGIVDNLVERELMLRRSDENDRRATICELTRKGGEYLSSLSELGESARGVTRTFLQNMSISELEQLAKAIELTHINFKQIMKIHYGDLINTE